MTKFYGYEDFGTDHPSGSKLFGGKGKTRSNGGVGRRGGGKTKLTPAQIKAAKRTIAREQAQAKKAIAAKKAAAKAAKKSGWW